MMKRRLSIVLLATVAAATALAAPKKVNRTASVTIDDMKFTPATVEISVGDTVQWTNNDVRDHNVSARDGSFASPNLGQGDSFPHTFTKAGKFNYGCSLHPRMKGTVIVSGD